MHTFTDVTQPAGLAAVGDLGPTHVVADRRGHLVVIDTRGNAVLRYELSPQPRQIGRVELPGSPYGVTYDPVRDRLWVTLTARNEVVGLDLGADPPVLATRLPTVRQPNTVAVDSGTGRLFVTGADEGVLEVIDL